MWSTIAMHICCYYSYRLFVLLSFFLSSDLFLRKRRNDRTRIPHRKLLRKPNEVRVPPNNARGLEGVVRVGGEDCCVYFVGGEFVHSFGLLLGGCYLGCDERTCSVEGSVRCARRGESFSLYRGPCRHLWWLRYNECRPLRSLVLSLASYSAHLC